MIYCLISFAVFSAASWQFVPHAISFVSAPAGKLIFIQPTEAFFTHLRVALWSGVFFSLPVVLYNIWKYIEAALLPNEKKYALIFAPFSFVLFLAGASFGLFIAIPLALKFLIGFGSGWAEPMLSINEYISFVGWLLLAFGLAFELPLVILFLSKLKIVNSRLLITHWKHAILIIFIASAVITPTPDALTQLLLVGPLIVLYGLGVWLSSFA